MTFWSHFTFTWWLGHFLSRYVKVQFLLIKYTCDSKSQTLRMRYPFQSTGRPISHRNVWSFRVYMIPLRDFVLEWHSRPGTTTGFFTQLHKLRSLRWSFLHFHFTSAVHVLFISYIINMGILLSDTDSVTHLQGVKRLLYSYKILLNSIFSDLSYKVL